jgi:hypothetical protein
MRDAIGRELDAGDVIAFAAHAPIATASSKPKVAIVLCTAAVDGPPDDDGNVKLVAVQRLDGGPRRRRRTTRHLSEIVLVNRARRLFEPVVEGLEPRVATAGIAPPAEVANIPDDPLPPVLPPYSPPVPPSGPEGPA